MINPTPTIYLCLLLVACAEPGSSAACPGSIGSPMRIFELFFGRAVPGRGDVSENEWKAFQDQIITANLPAGYTVLDGIGAWMNPKTHITIRESTKILTAATPDTPGSLAAIQRLRSAYKIAFNQTSVGMTNYPGCGSFDQ